MRILLLVDTTGNELKLWRNPEKNLNLKLTHNSNEESLIYELDEKDIEYLITELRDLKNTLYNES